MTLSKHQLVPGYGIGVLAAALLSTTAIFIRYLTVTYSIAPLVLAFWRDGFVTVILFPVLVVWRSESLRVGWRKLGYLIGYGLLLAVFNGLWTLSVALNGAAISTVLAYSSTGFTVILGWAFLKERLDVSKVAAVGLTLTGCTLVAGITFPLAWQPNIPGITAGVLTGLSYAIYSLMGRSASNRGLNPWVTLAYTFAFASVFLLLGNLLPGGILPGAASRPADLFSLGNALAGWGILFLLAAGPTILGFGLYNLSLAYLPSSIANILVSLEPAFTALIAYFFLGERLTGMQILGGFLILVAVITLRLYESWYARAPLLRRRASKGTILPIE